MNYIFAMNYLRSASPSSVVRNGASSSIVARFFSEASASPSTRTQHVDESEIDHFGILGVERTFTIPFDELKTKYKHLMKDLHPDKHATANKDVVAQKAAMATDVTRAYGVIGDPLSRALHLLELHGSPIKESNDQSLVDHAFLFEIMEIREEIENASSDEEMRPILQSSVAKKGELIDQIAEAFREERIDDAKQLAVKLKYWVRIEEAVVDKMTCVHKQQ